MMTERLKIIPVSSVVKMEYETSGSSLTLKNGIQPPMSLCIAFFAIHNGINTIQILSMKNIIEISFAIS